MLPFCTASFVTRHKVVPPMYRKKVRMCQIGHIRTGSAVSPYVGIIQIRLRVRATQPTLSLLDASPPFVQKYSSTAARHLQDKFSAAYSCSLNARNSRLACAGSWAEKIALTTATPARPRPCSCRIFPASMPPMATTGDGHGVGHGGHRLGGDRVRIQLGAGHKRRATAKVVRTVRLCRQGFGGVMR